MPLPPSLPPSVRTFLWAFRPPSQASRALLRAAPPRSADLTARGGVQLACLACRRSPHSPMTARARFCQVLCRQAPAVTSARRPPPILRSHAHSAPAPPTPTRTHSHAHAHPTAAYDGARTCRTAARRRVSHACKARAWPRQRAPADAVGRVCSTHQPPTLPPSPRLCVVGTCDSSRVRLPRREAAVGTGSSALEEDCDSAAATPTAAASQNHLRPVLERGSPSKSSRFERRRGDGGWLQGHFCSHFRSASLPQESRLRTRHDMQRSANTTTPTQRTHYHCRWCVAGSSSGGHRHCSKSLAAAVALSRPRACLPHAWVRGSRPLPRPCAPSPHSPGRSRSPRFAWLPPRQPATRLAVLPHKPHTKHRTAAHHSTFPPGTLRPAERLERRVCAGRVCGVLCGRSVRQALCLRDRGDGCLLVRLRRRWPVTVERVV